MKWPFAALLSLLRVSLVTAANPAPPAELWDQIRDASGLGELRGVTVELDRPGPDRAIRFKVTDPVGGRYAWLTFPAPASGWSLERRKTVEAQVSNRSERPMEAALWVVGRRGWDAVTEFAKLAPGESRRCVCDLRSSFPDGTPKIDPSQVSHVQVMLRSLRPGDAVEVRGLRADGQALPWVRPAGRIEVPDMASGHPAPGRRVAYVLGEHRKGAAYSVLYLPEDWMPGARYPVIAEYPGNVFYDPSCYSTGRPERCVIGYGMSEGKGAIWVSLPFVDSDAAAIVEYGWGDADATADYAVRTLDEICRKFGGDRDNLVLTGFSRGAIACGFIGLRNNRIAGLWKGMHTCQHFDGDGWGGAAMPGALDRAKRFAGREIFHTDNSNDLLRRIMAGAGISAVYAESGLQAHSSAMCLDGRPSTLKLREWFRTLVHGR